MAKTDRRAIYKICISQKALLTNIPQTNIYNPPLIGVPSPFLPTETGMAPVMSGTPTNNLTGRTVYSNMYISFAEAPIPKSDVTDNQMQRKPPLPPSRQNTHTSTVFPAQ